MVEASLAKTRAAEQRLPTTGEFQRLQPYLVSQGFESDRILKALNARKSSR